MPDGKAAIDALRETGGGLSREAIREILPYGDDFLFVDEVSKLDENEVEASYRIPAEAPYVRSHFAGFPLMPGALIAEGFAQAGTLIVRYNLDGATEHDILGIQIDSARFLSPAYPGDTLTYRARLTTMDRRAARIEGEVRVGDRRVAKLKLVVGIVDRKAFRESRAQS